MCCFNDGLQSTACVGRAKRDFGELNLHVGLSVPQCPIISLRPVGSLVNASLWSCPVRGLLLLHTLALMGWPLRQLRAPDEVTLVGLCSCTHTQTGGHMEPDPGLPVSHVWVAITTREHRVLFRACPISPVVQEKQQNHKVAGVL